MRQWIDDENDLMGDINELLSGDTATQIAPVVEVEEPKVEEDVVIVPFQYKVFTTHNNEATGKRDGVDSFLCDRSRGIVPIGKVRIKADNMKKVFKNKVYFVLEVSHKVYPNNKTVTVEKIVYQTK